MTELEEINLKLQEVERKIDYLTSRILDKTDVALSITQAARILNVSTATIYRRINAGIIQQKYIGGVYGISQDELRRL